MTDLIGDKFDVNAVLLDLWDRASKCGLPFVRRYTQKKVAIEAFLLRPDLGDGVRQVKQVWLTRPQFKAELQKMAEAEVAANILTVRGYARASEGVREMASELGIKLVGARTEIEWTTTDITKGAECGRLKRCWCVQWLAYLQGALWFHASNIGDTKTYERMLALALDAKRSRDLQDAIVGAFKLQGSEGVLALAI